MGRSGVGADPELSGDTLVGTGQWMQVHIQTGQELRRTRGWRKKLRNRWPRDNLSGQRNREGSKRRSQNPSGRAVSRGGDRWAGQPAEHGVTVSTEDRTPGGAPAPLPYVNRGQ